MSVVDQSPYSWQKWLRYDKHSLLTDRESIWHFIEHHESFQPFVTSRIPTIIKQLTQLTPTRVQEVFKFVYSQQSIALMNTLFQSPMYASPDIHSYSEAAEQARRVCYR